MPLDSNDISKVNRFIAADIKKTLRLQGHYLTGALEASITDDVNSSKDNTTLSAKAFGYIEDLEKGIPASEIKINSQSLAEMTRYVELRMGYRGSKAQQVALLVLQAQQREGNPTENSYNFSQIGSRKFAIEITFNKNEDRYFNLIDGIVEKYVDTEFNKLKSGTI